MDFALLMKERLDVIFTWKKFPSFLSEISDISFLLDFFFEISSSIKLNKKWLKLKVSEISKFSLKFKWNFKLQRAWKFPSANLGWNFTWNLQYCPYLSGCCMGAIAQYVPSSSPSCLGAPPIWRDIWQIFMVHCKHVVSMQGLNTKLFTKWEFFFKCGLWGWVEKMYF